jgi:hypothetical protein
MHKNSPNKNMCVAHEIIIGLVAGAGTALQKVVFSLTKQFNSTKKYTTQEIHVSTLLDYMLDEYKTAPMKNSASKIEDRIEKCNKFREKLERNDAMAVLSLAEIRKKRYCVKNIGAIYIVNQIKNSSEVKFMLCEKYMEKILYYYQFTNIKIKEKTDY